MAAATTMTTAVVTVAVGPGGRDGQRTDDGADKDGFEQSRHDFLLDGSLFPDQFNAIQASPLTKSL
jgi:hypothetical protein